MINEDIRNIIEPELHDGEELLWAESVDKALREKWISKSVKDDCVWAFPFLIIGVLIAWLTIKSPSQRHPDAELWVVLLGMIPFLLFAGLFLLASFFGFRSFFGREHYHRKRPFKFYVLTNERLLYFGMNDELLAEFKALQPKKVELFKRWFFPNKWKPICLVMSPVGPGVWKMAELYFLSDYEDSQKQILSALKRKDA